MTSKKTQEVLIDGKVYKLSGYEQEEYLQNVASYINRKIEELHGMDSYRKLTSDQQSLLVELNVADDYFKAKERISELEKELEDRQKELYDLKHELALAKVQKK